MRSLLAIFPYASLAMLTISLLPVQAKWLTVPERSPLHELVEEYLPNDYKDGEDPLTSSDMKTHSTELVNLGWRYFNAKDLDTALKRFMLAIRTDRKNASAYFGVAYVCSIQNNIDDAITFYREALRFEKKFAPIYANLARALLMKDHHSAEAPKLLDEAIAVNPKFPESYITYARYYIDRDDWKMAAEKANQSVAIGRKLEPEIVLEFKQHGIKLREN